MEDEILQRLVRMQGSGYSGGGLVGGALPNKGLEAFHSFAKPLYDKNHSKAQVLAEWKKTHPPQDKRAYAKQYREDVKAGRRIPVPRPKSQKLEGMSAEQIQKKAALLDLKRAKRQNRK